MNMSNPLNPLTTKIVNLSKVNSINVIYWARISSSMSTEKTITILPEQEYTIQSIENVSYKIENERYHTIAVIYNYSTHDKSKYAVYDENINIMYDFHNEHDTYYVYDVNVIES